MADEQRSFDRSQCFNNERYRNQIDDTSVVSKVSPRAQWLKRQEAFHARREGKRKQRNQSFTKRYTLGEYGA